MVNFAFFDSELYVFKKLTVYGYQLCNNSHHDYLKPDNKHNGGQDQRLNVAFRLSLKEEKDVSTTDHEAY